MCDPAPRCRLRIEARVAKQVAGLVGAALAVGEAAAHYSDLGWRLSHDHVVTLWRGRREEQTDPELGILLARLFPRGHKGPGFENELSTAFGSARSPVLGRAFRQPAADVLIRPRLEVLCDLFHPLRQDINEQRVAGVWASVLRAGLVGKVTPSEGAVANPGELRVSLEKAPAVEKV